MSGETLSAYELERLANIKRNQKVLVELGLEPKTPLRKKLAPVKRAKKEVDPDYAPERRATRVSSGRGKSARDAHNNSDSDSEDEDAVQIRRPHKIVKRPVGHGRVEVVHALIIPRFAQNQQAGGSCGGFTIS